MIFLLAGWLAWKLPWNVLGPMYNVLRLMLVVRARVHCSKQVIYLSSEVFHVFHALFTALHFTHPTSVTHINTINS